MGKIRSWFRSAVTGRFVSKLFAKLNPDTTVAEQGVQACPRCNLKNWDRSQSGEWYCKSCGFVTP